MIVALLIVIALLLFQVVRSLRNIGSNQVATVRFLDKRLKK